MRQVFLALMMGLGAMQAAYADNESTEPSTTNDREYATHQDQDKSEAQRDWERYAQERAQIVCLGGD